MSAFNNVFRERRVFITGHTGFKGSWLTAWLISLGAKVFGYALTPQPHETLFDQLRLGNQIEADHRADVRDRESLKRALSDCKPDFVFHLAAQPLVRLSYTLPVETLETNVMGTVNLLDAVRDCHHQCAVVVVTTDKCYENKEWLYSYRESDPMGGHDPYSASKGCAELVTSAFRSSFFSSAASNIYLASGRAGNVIGGGDWAIDRIVPDVFRSIMSSRPVSVRNKTATRPWQHVLEPLSGYLWLAANLLHPQFSEFPREAICSAFNFGPSLSSNRSVANVVDGILAHVDGAWVDRSDPSQPHEAAKLNLSIDKAFHILRWSPVWDFEKCITETASWYLRANAGEDPVELTTSCIRQYESDARFKELIWA